MCLLVLSFSRFVFSITFAFSFRFPAPWWRNSSFVSVLHPPALLASLKVCVFPFACFLLSCFPASHLFIRSSLPFLFLARFPFGCRWCHPVFSLWVLCGLPVPVSAGTRLAYILRNLPTVYILCQPGSKYPKLSQHQGTRCSGRGRFLETRKAPLRGPRRSYNNPARFFPRFFVKLVFL